MKTLALHRSSAQERGNKSVGGEKRAGALSDASDDAALIRERIATASNTISSSVGTYRGGRPYRAAISRARSPGWRAQSIRAPTVLTPRYVSGAAW